MRNLFIFGKSIQLYFKPNINQKNPLILKVYKKYSIKLYKIKSKIIKMSK